MIKFFCMHLYFNPTRRNMKEDLNILKMGVQIENWWSENFLAVEKCLVGKTNVGGLKYFGSQKQDALIHSLTNGISVLYKLNMCRINKASKQE
jgi:hypothetical protein